jgi:hypothetical protein
MGCGDAHTDGAEPACDSVVSPEMSSRTGEDAASGDAQSRGAGTGVGSGARSAGGCVEAAHASAWRCEVAPVGAAVVVGAVVVFATGGEVTGEAGGVVSAEAPGGGLVDVVETEGGGSGVLGVVGAGGRDAGTSPSRDAASGSAGVGEVISDDWSPSSELAGSATGSSTSAPATTGSSSGASSTMGFAVSPGDGLSEVGGNCSSCAEPDAGCASASSARARSQHMLTRTQAAKVSATTANHRVSARPGRGRARGTWCTPVATTVIGQTVVVEVWRVNRRSACSLLTSVFFDGSCPRRCSGYERGRSHGSRRRSTPNPSLNRHSGSRGR